MYRIKLKITSKNKFDEIIEIEEEQKAFWKYRGYMDDNYYFGSLVKIVDEKEQNMASFCNSQFAKITN